MGKIVLIADSLSLADPTLLGLEDIALDKLDWLELLTSGRLAREYISKASDIEEVWILSSDDVEAINIAAALKSDLPSLYTVLMLNEMTGSALSRAQAAGISETLSSINFTVRFSIEHARRSRMAEVSSLKIDAPSVRITKDDIDTSDGDDTSYGDVLAETENNTEGKVEVERTDDPHAPIVTFFSGSGGAGKSTLCATASFSLSRAGIKVLALDCDLQFGDMHHLFGENDPVTIDQALEDLSCIASMARSASEDKPMLLAAPKKLERFETIGNHLNELLDESARHFDIILVNTGASWADYHATLLERSLSSLFIIDQRSSSIRACKHAIDLCTRMGIATGTFSYVLNHCMRGSLFNPLDISCVMDGVHVYEVKEGGDEVEEYLGAGNPWALMSSNNEMCVSIESMLKDILADIGWKEDRDGGFMDIDPEKGKRTTAHAHERRSSKRSIRRRSNRSDKARSHHKGIDRNEQSALANSGRQIRSR